MTKYVRVWNCHLCKQRVIYDDQAKTMSCGCGTRHHVISDQELMHFKTTGVYMEFGTHKYKPRGDIEEIPYGRK